MKRPAARPSWLAGVVTTIAPVLLCPHTASGQEGPIVVGQRQKPPIASLYGWRGELEFLWRQRAESREVDGDSDDLDETHLEQTITVETQGHIYHPNLVELNLSGTFGLTQTWLDSETESSFNPGYVNEYDLSALILRKEVAPVTLYTRRTQDLLNREFGPTLDYVFTQTGAIWDIRSKTVPTRLEIYHSNQTQSGIADSDGSSAEDFDLTQNVFTWHSEYRPRETHVLTWDYTLSQVSENTPNFPDNDYWLNDAGLAYSIDFGIENRSNFLSSLTVYDQTGDFPIFRARWLEELRLYHSAAFQTRYQFSYDRQSFTSLAEDTLDQDRLRGVTGFTHRLYESLETRGNVGAEKVDRSDDSGSTEYFGDLNFDYNKKVPFGRLNLFLTLAYDWQDNQQQVSPTPFVDVPRQFSDPTPIILIGNGIDPNSIRITDPSGIVLFRPGDDYTITSFSDRVEINRVVGGRIPNGQAVLIDYLLVPQAANTSTTTYYAFGGRYDIELGREAILSLYARYARQDQDIDTDSPASFTPNSFTDIIYGFDYRWRGLRVGIERETRDANISPFDAMRYVLTYDHRFSRELSVNFNTTFTQIDYPDDDNHADLLAVSGSVQYRFTRDLYLSASIVWRDENDDLRGPTRGLEEQFEFNWRRRQTTVYGLLRNANLETDFQDNSFLLAEIGVRREF
jgi:hypothetical protein